MLKTRLSESTFKVESATTRNVSVNFMQHNASCSRFFVTLGGIQATEHRGLTFSQTCDIIAFANACRHCKEKCSLRRFPSPCSRWHFLFFFFFFFSPLAFLYLAFTPNEEAPAIALFPRETPTKCRWLSGPGLQHTRTSL
uniref:Uncharacterized protein n=1 Tax=Myotis myotis TaxID=51298 RepID=A0A7J7VWR6_MYOMY|nr:hypothetical protein mMyoMyo1_001962 [Myotis myotis]